MTDIRTKLAEKIAVWRPEIRTLVKEHGETKVSDVTLAQVYGGMRGIKGLCCDTSTVDPHKGLVVRGTPIGELTHMLPEAIWYLLLTGEMPTDDDLKPLQKELIENMAVPSYVWDVLRHMPANSHPMCMFSTAILVMEKESRFRAKYHEGMQKVDYWKATLDDCIYLVAKLPTIAAGIYRMRYEKGDLIDPDPTLDWGANYAHMLGIDDASGDFKKLIQLYLTVHCDHEGGNVSAFTSQTIGSALSSVFYSLSGGLNGLSGPLHGLANQECLGFVLGVYEKFGKVPTDDELTSYAWELLNSGRVIPGYGHAVLRVTDPRFTALHQFGKDHCPESPIFQIVDRLFHLVPEILKKHGKAKSPWPNVDAGSGMLLFHYGLKEFDYYTVLFGVSRALGITSQLVINRAMLLPITRPKSVSTQWLKNLVASS